MATDPRVSYSGKATAPGSISIHLDGGPLDGLMLDRTEREFMEGRPLAVPARGPAGGVEGEDHVDTLAYYLPLLLTGSGARASHIGDNLTADQLAKYPGVPIGDEAGTHTEGVGFDPAFVELPGIDGGRVFAGRLPTGGTVHVLDGAAAARLFGLAQAAAGVEPSRRDLAVDAVPVKLVGGPADGLVVTTWAAWYAAGGDLTVLTPTPTGYMVAAYRPGGQVQEVEVPGEPDVIAFMRRGNYDDTRPAVPLADDLQHLAVGPARCMAASYPSRWMDRLAPPVPDALSGAVVPLLHVCDEDTSPVDFLATLGIEARYVYLDTDVPDGSPFDRRAIYAGNFSESEAPRIDADGFVRLGAWDNEDGEAVALYGMPHNEFARSILGASVAAEGQSVGYDKANPSPLLCPPGFGFAGKSAPADQPVDAVVFLRAFGVRQTPPGFEVADRDTPATAPPPEPFEVGPEPEPADDFGPGSGVGVGYQPREDDAP